MGHVTLGEKRARRGEPVTSMGSTSSEVVLSVGHGSRFCEKVKANLMGIVWFLQAPLNPF